MQPPVLTISSCVIPSQPLIATGMLFIQKHRKFKVAHILLSTGFMVVGYENFTG
jgi:hypothetical protein